MNPLTLLFESTKKYDFTSEVNGYTLKRDIFGFRQK